MIARTITIVILLSFFTNASAQPGEAATAAKLWWRAVTFGDTAYLQQHSTQEITVVFSNGKKFNRKEILAQVAKHDPAAKIGMEWSDEVVQLKGNGTAIVTHQVVEQVGPNTGPLRFITVLVKVGKAWKVTAAQSTKITQLSNRVPLTVAGNLTDYTGNYRTPSGAIIKVAVKDSSLVLIDPSGGETALEPIGPGLFEPPGLHTVGNVRIAFSRDATGRVIAFSRITNKVTTMHRVE